MNCCRSTNFNTLLQSSIGNSNQSLINRSQKIKKIINPNDILQSTFFNNYFKFQNKWHKTQVNQESKYISQKYNISYSHLMKIWNRIMFKLLGGSELDLYSYWISWDHNQIPLTPLTKILFENHECKDFELYYNRNEKKRFITCMPTI